MKHRTTYRVISILIGLFLVISGLEIVLRVLPVNEGLMQLPVNDKNPIIRFKQNRDFRWSKGWDFSIIARKHSNNYGFINDQDYDRDSIQTLMAIIGDSYVGANQVENSVTMHGVLSEKVKRIGRVYSFGASGSNLPSYLAYAVYVRDKFRANSLVFVIVGNDFDESLIKYKTVPGFHYFDNDDNGQFLLKRINYQISSIKNLARQFALARYIVFNLGWNWRSLERRIFYPAVYFASYVGNTSAEAKQDRLSDSKIAVKEFFHRLPGSTGLTPTKVLFVVDGRRPQIYSDSELEDSKGSYFAIMRNYFIDIARKKGYEVIDMEPIFVRENRANGSRFEFRIDGHWNALAHKLVAEQIELSSVFSRTFR